jgi:hypothetical protein
MIGADYATQAATNICKSRMSNIFALCVSDAR